MSESLTRGIPRRGVDDLDVPLPRIAAESPEIESNVLAKTQAVWKLTSLLKNYEPLEDYEVIDVLKSVAALYGTTLVELDR